MGLLIFDLMSASSAGADERFRAGSPQRAGSAALLIEAMARLAEAATPRQVTDALMEAFHSLFDPCTTSLVLLDEGPGELEQRPPVRDALRSGEVTVEATRAAVPLAVRRRILGAIALGFERAPSFDVEQLELLRVLGRAGAGALERARSCERGLFSAEREAQLERRLEWADAELRAAWDNAPVGLNLVDRDLRFRRVNRVCAEINGTSIEGHIGKTVSEVLPSLAPDLEPKMRRVLEAGEVFDEIVEAETPAQPGRWRDWHAMYYPMRDASGAIVGVASTVHDVTAEREADRQRLRRAARDTAFVQATSVILWVLDATGRPVEDSPSWRAFTGFGWSGSTAGQWSESLHPDDRERTRAAWNDAVSAKRVFQCEMRVRRRDGVYVWMLARAVPVLDERGEIVEWAGANTDITEHKLAQEQREATLRLAEQFIGILGHDLRNPIAAIRMAAQLTRRSAGDPSEVRHLADRTIASASRMGNMVTQLLDFTRVRLGRGLNIERRPTNLGQVVDAAIDELRLVHPGRTIDGSCQGVVEGSWDGDRLAQVVSNLVGNALQHGDAARPVEVRLGFIESDALLEVQSYGTPIAPDLLPHLFEPYRQGPRHKGKSQGLGLGLYITQQIVHAHGGRIEVRSGAAEGTRFTVTLPRA
jgi:PAS domain S-box-containing protein